MREIERRPGLFGIIRIKERTRDRARLYCVGDSVQTMAMPDGTSLFGYVHAIKLLIAGAKDVLLLGGGGGSLATMLARRGGKVTVVDIDPAAEGLARRHFSLHPRVRWVTRDASSYLRTCIRSFDAVVFDTCDARGFVSELATTGALLTAFSVVRAEGSVVLNLPSNGATDYAWQLASAMVDKGFSAALLRPALGDEANELLHIRMRGPAGRLAVNDFADRPAEALAYLTTLRSMTPRQTKPIAARKRHLL